MRDNGWEVEMQPEFRKRDLRSTATTFVSVEVKEKGVQAWESGIKWNLERDSETMNAWPRSRGPSLCRGGAQGKLSSRGELRSPQPSYSFSPGRCCSDPSVVVLKGKDSF